MPSILEAKSEVQVDPKAKWVAMAFWGGIVLLVMAVFCYGLFWLKTSLLNDALIQVESAALQYANEKEKDAEKNVLATQKKVNDFATVLNSQKTTLPVFAFVEQNTLPNVWFSNFNLSQTSNELRLSGEAESMATLSQQFKRFEDSVDYIKNISVFNSQISTTGRVNFLLNMTILPKMFEYKPPVAPVAPLEIPPANAN